MRYTGDLHNHTYFSDGKLSPYQVVSIYSRLGYRLISITDHDVIDGYLNAVKLKNLTPNLILIPGCEMTISMVRGNKKFSIHLLLYFRKEDVFKSEFKKDMDELTELGRGKKLLKRRLESLKKYFPEYFSGIDVSDITSRGSVITRKHIFELLLSKGVEENVAGRIVSNSSPAYIPSGVPIENIVPFLKKYSMIKIFAHPAVGSSDNPVYEKDLYPPMDEVLPIIEEFTSKGILDGLEVFYPAHSKEHMEFLLNFGKDLGLKIFTGGSDSHDLRDRPPAKIGMTESYVREFLKLYRKL